MWGPTYKKDEKPKWEQDNAANVARNKANAEDSIYLQWMIDHRGQVVTPVLGSLIEEGLALVGGHSGGSLAGNPAAGGRPPRL